MSSSSHPEPVVLDGGGLSLQALEAVARHGRAVALDEKAREAVTRARKVVDDAVARGTVVYGITTGFGNFADVVIPADRLRELQLNLVRSHAAGVGEPLDEPETRALMVLRANVLAKGFSGIRAETLDLLIEMINRRIHPLIPSQGSVGASGDLAPLAHLALALIGEGACLHRVVPGLLDQLSQPGRSAPPPWFPAPVAEATQIVLLVIDGLGAEQLRARSGLAPVLTSGTGGSITTVAPSTTGWRPAAPRVSMLG